MGLVRSKPTLGDPALAMPAGVVPPSTAMMVPHRVAGHGTKSVAQFLEPQRGCVWGGVGS